MNDRLNFRVWDNNKKEYRDNGYIHRKGYLIMPTMKNDYSLEEAEGDFVIEQFTGLKDNNGKLIYEGDIVKDTSFDEDSCAGREIVETSIVCFGGGEYPCSFTLKNKRFYRGYALLNYGVNRLELEVIGNIHENRDLMEESK